MFRLPPPPPLQEVHPGVQQYASTCLQNHCIWSKLEFWRGALYLAIQAELVRIYAEAELSERTAGSSGRKMSESMDGECVFVCVCVQ